jgi:hypothetical protein
LGDPHNCAGVRVPDRAQVASAYPKRSAAKLFLPENLGLGPHHLRFAPGCRLFRPFAKVSLFDTILKDHFRDGIQKQSKKGSVGLLLLQNFGLFNISRVAQVIYVGD